MIKRLRDNRIMSWCLLLGLLAAISLCGIRFRAETSNNKVAFCMPDEDIRVLAEAEGIAFSEYRKILNDAGFTEGLSDDKAFWLVEDDVAYSYLPVPGFTPEYDTPMIRVMRVRPEWGKRYGTLGYEGAQEVENLIYRAISDRNIRVVEFTAFRDNSTEEIISSPDEYVQVIQNLDRRIRQHGLELGDEYSVFAPYSPSKILIALTAFGVCAAGIFLILCVIGIPKKIQYIFLGIAFAGSFASVLIMERLAIQIFALGAAIVFPCISIWYVARTLAEDENSGKRTISRYVGILSASIGIAVVGGVFISALQSSTFFLLAIENFRGVKLSQALPVFFSLLIVWRALYGRAGVKSVMREVLTGRNFMVLLVFAVLAAGVVFFLLRTGDGFLEAGVLEQRFRNWLENVLLVRPRTKEFLVAWPCVALSLVLADKEKKSYIWPFAVLSSTGFASVVNTFCHSRSPIWLSLARTVYGLIIGAVLGIVLIRIGQLWNMRERKK